MKYTLLLTLIFSPSLLALQLPQSPTDQKLLTELDQKVVLIKKKDAFLKLAFKKNFTIEPDGQKLLQLVKDGVSISTQAANGQTAFIYAALTNQSELAGFLLQQPHISVDVRDMDGKTALDYAEKHADKVIYHLIKVYKKLYTLDHTHKLIALENHRLESSNATKVSTTLKTYPLWAARYF